MQDARRKYAGHTQHARRTPDAGRTPRTRRTHAGHTQDTRPAHAGRTQDTRRTHAGRTQDFSGHACTNKPFAKLSCAFVLPLPFAPLPPPPFALVAIPLCVWQCNFHQRQVCGAQNPYNYDFHYKNCTVLYILYVSIFIIFGINFYNFGKKIKKIVLSVSIC